MNPDEPLIRFLRAQAERVLRDLDLAAARCALLDFPNHSNAGDSAIWIGEKLILSHLGADVVTSCDTRTYRKETIKRNLGVDGTILLHGGGNFGDKWPKHDLFRRKVIADFPDNRIIVLPQTVHFRELQFLERSVKAFDRHEGITILTRDRRSLSVIKDHFLASAILCPDLAFFIRTLPRHIPTQRVVRLLRTDTEVRSPTARPTGEDWLAITRHDQRTAPFRFGSYQVRRKASGLLTRIPSLRGVLAPFIERGFDSTAHFHLERAVRLISRGDVVITDRLHGHVLCMLLGTPHVVIDSGYGKLTEFLDTWTRKSALAVMASSWPEAERLAAQLLQPGPVN